jgi:hypothetical protein
MSLPVRSGGRFICNQPLASGFSKKTGSCGENFAPKGSQNHFDFASATMPLPSRRRRLLGGLDLAGMRMLESVPHESDE